MARYVFNWGHGQVHTPETPDIRDRVFLANDSAQLTITSTGDAMDFYIGRGWPAVFDDRDRRTVAAGAVFTQQLAFDAVRFPTVFGGPVTVEIFGPDDLAPIRATIEEEA